MQASGFEERIGVTFHDRALLARSLTHRSYANEVGQPASCNETLEFLGDALLGFLVAELMALETTLRDEGEMTKVKSRLVSEPVLAAAARELDLGKHLKLSRGEDKTGGREKPSILADAYEAVLAAVYLDQGIGAARRFVARDFRAMLVDLCRPGAAADPKSLLQELCHQLGLPMPRYRLAEAEGPEHARTFVVECDVASLVTSSGAGTSKKEAERLAARHALDMLSTRNPPLVPEAR
ncbi:MAG: ribonuclease III [Acidobacteriota bacterium]